jgi:hypothetical protein
MGCSSSLDESIKNSIHENMLASVISGTTAEDDYLARSHKTLNDLEIAEDGPHTGHLESRDFMDINNAYLMLEPGPQPLEHGIIRQNDGTWFIAALTDLGKECTGEMFDWWIRNCTDTERFKWWHPKDHKAGDWDPQFFAVQPEDRKPGHYIHHSHRIKQDIGGKLRTLQIDYERPSKYFDVSKFDQAGMITSSTILSQFYTFINHVVNSSFLI